TPGKIACAIASPIKLIRRNTRITPSGPAANASENDPASARRMKANSVKGPKSKSMAFTGSLLHTNVEPNADFQALTLDRFRPNPRPDQPTTTYWETRRAPAQDHARQQ